MAGIIASEGNPVKSKAYCPGHISTIFRVCIHKNPILSGSRGAGIVIDEGVITEAETVPGSGVDIYFNGKRQEFRPSFVMADKMTAYRDNKKVGGWGLEDGHQKAQRGNTLDYNKKIIIRHTTKLPVGAGFGASAACVMGAGLCLNSLFSLDMPTETIKETAHVTEVECGTGLGDVGPMLAGGVEMRRKEGVHGTVESISAGTDDLVCFSFGPIDTGSAINSSSILKLNQLADNILPKLFSNPTFDNFMACSLEFSKNAGFLTPRLEKVIDQLNMIDGCLASQTMLGESGFAVFKNDINKKVLDELKHIERVFQTKITCKLPELIQ
ncbi:MAG: hypothetical protein U9Q92_06660 [archaeon]|nr:hypothetical protein [archaeon]